jgi:outer membrane receptor protein involved in Fe transport
MDKLLKQLLLGGSATVLFAAAPLGFAYAQPAADDSIETVNSSASRIDLKGFEAPTPVTVIGIDTLNRDAKVQLGDEIRELPQVRGGTSISSGSGTNNLSNLNAGADTVAIRGLGANRNLVLFDRQRVVISSFQDGNVDLALIPSGLTQRVDVVTGGASAAWGSDAVTGVINIVLNKTYEGFKGNITYSNNTEVENSAYRASLAWGTSFLGGKGHIVAATDWTVSNTTLWPGDLMRRGVNRNDGRGLVYNSAYCNAVSFPGAATTGGTCSSLSGQPLLVYRYGLGSTQAVVGGLTSANTAGVAGSGLGANSLKGTMFVGGSATPTAFNYGTVYNVNTCYNGCTNNQYGTGNWTPSKQPYHSGTYFTYASYQLTPDIKASVQLNYARLTTRANGGAVGGTNRVIYADNPNIPDSIAQRFVCQGGAVFGTAGASCLGTLSNGYNPFTHQNDIGALTLAQRQARPAQTMTTNFEFSGNRDNPSPSSLQSVDSVDYNQDEFCQAIQQNCGYYNKAFMRGVFTLDGTLGDDWTWTAYIQHSNSRIKENIASPIQARLNNSLDAVRITSGNAGTSGLPIGSIQCRALLNPGLAAAIPANSFGITAAGELAGCVPFDPFGTGALSSAAFNYINPGANPSASGIQSTVVANMQQEAGSFSMNGVLPWQMPAGEIGVALGGEWRLERQGQYKVDPRSQIGLYPSGNFGTPFEGKQHVEEGFVEVAVPILKNQFVQTLNVDAAGRLTNYSNSGLVETWKIGVQSQIIDDVKFRMTWSYDIRAPTIYDLSVPSSLGNQTCPSFIIGSGGSNGGQSNQCFEMRSGNPTLGPERANTIAAGFVFTPSFLDGVTASIDWYQIHLHGAIVTPGLSDVIARCRNGETVYCPLIVFDNGQPYPQGTVSQIDAVKLIPVNAGILNTAGYDFSVAYGFNLFTGTADVSFNGNWVTDFSRLLNGVYFNGAGASGGYYPGGARFQGTLNGNYREGAWSFGLQVHLQGDSVMDKGNPGNDPNIKIQGVTYALVSGVLTPTVGSGQRDPITGAETNYNAWQATTDIRVQYRWDNNITLFANVDNIQNLPFGGTFRRSYRMGVRFNY